MSILYPPPTPLIGTFAGQPNGLCKPPPEGPRAVRVSIDFTTQSIAPNFSVSINLQNTAVATNPISQIASVYIDNSNNSNNVNIYFPDTQYFIEVAALSQGYYPVITNALQAIVWNSAVNTNDTVVLFFMNNFVTNYSISENIQSRNYLLGSNGVQYQEVAGDIIQSGSIGVTAASPGLVYLCGSGPSTLVKCTIKSIEVSTTNLFATNNTFSFFINISNAGVIIQREIDIALGVTPNTPYIELYSNQDLQYPVNNGYIQLEAAWGGSGTPWYGNLIATSVYYTVCYTTR